MATKLFSGRQRGPDIGHLFTRAWPLGIACHGRGAGWPPEIAGHEGDASEAKALIREATALIDNHAASGIREANKRRLTDLLATFDQALKEFHA